MTFCDGCTLNASVIWGLQIAIAFAESLALL
jgi:hypothetical protein